MNEVASRVPTAGGGVTPDQKRVLSAPRGRCKKSDPSSSNNFLLAVCSCVTSLHFKRLVQLGGSIDHSRADEAYGSSSVEEANGGGHGQSRTFVSNTKAFNRLGCERNID